MVAATIMYFTLSLMVAFMGRRTRLGFFRTFLFSILLTPMVIMVYLLIFVTIEAEEAEERQQQGGNDSRDRR
jgi:hypothetical protein